MPSRKRQAPQPWQVILEEMRSQNRSTIEAVDATRVVLGRDLETLDQNTRSRFASLEAALQRFDHDSRSRDASLEVALRDLKVSIQQNSLDIRDLAVKVEALAGLEQRVSALERPAAP